MDYTSLGLSLVASITAVALSSVATGNQSPSIDDIMDEYVNLHVYGWIKAPRYLRTKIINETNTFTDTEIEEVGNMSIEEEDTNEELSTTRFSAKNHILVTKRRYRVKPSAMQLLDQTTHCSLESSNPVNFYSDFLTLKGQNITSSNIIVSGLVGNKGEQGTKGEMGMVGTKGEKGILGIKGVKGDAGLQAAVGENGLDGKDGAKGAKGIEGKVGIVGLVGVSFDFVKIWPDQSSKDTDEGTVPRPPDFPSAGQYGLVSDDGKVYLSDGLNLTEVDDISEQGANGEAGEKGEKGAVGTVGDSGVMGTVGSKGPIGEKGFIGLTGLVQGEKGVKGESATGGSLGDFGDNGPAGAQGPSGDFSMDGFEEIVKPTIASIVQGPTNTFTINVLNPVYSLPVNVWAYTTAALDPPSAQQIQDNGTLINVLVDTSGVGNGLYTNPTPGTKRFVWFTWTDNDGDLQDVLGPLSPPPITISVKSGKPATYTLFIDGKLTASLNHSGGDLVQQIGNTLFSNGQDYRITLSNRSSQYVCFVSDDDDPAEGTIDVDNILVSYVCNDAYFANVSTSSTSSGNQVIWYLDVTQPNGESFREIKTQTMSLGSSNNLNFLSKIAENSVVALSSPTPGVTVTNSPFVMTQDYTFVATCELYQVSVQIEAAQNGSFEFFINGARVETSFYISNFGTFPYYLLPGDTYEIRPVSGSLCEIFVIGDETGTITNSNVTVVYNCSGTEFVVNWNESGASRTFDLILNNVTVETQASATAPLAFLTRGTIGDTYEVVSQSVDCTSTNNSGTISSNSRKNITFSCSQKVRFRVFFNDAPKTFTLELGNQTYVETFISSPGVFGEVGTFGDTWSIVESTGNCTSSNNFGTVDSSLTIVNFLCPPPRPPVFPGPVANTNASSYIELFLNSELYGYPPSGLSTNQVKHSAPGSPLPCDGKQCTASGQLAFLPASYPENITSALVITLDPNNPVTLQPNASVSQVNGSGTLILNCSNSPNGARFNFVTWSSGPVTVLADRGTSGGLPFINVRNFFDIDGFGGTSQFGTEQDPIILYSETRATLPINANYYGILYTRGNSASPQTNDLTIASSSNLYGAATTEGNLVVSFNATATYDMDIIQRCFDNSAEANSRFNII